MKIKPGESVTVTVIRDGKTKEVKVKLKQQKNNQNVKADQNVNHLAKAIEISLDNLQTVKIKSLLIFIPKNVMSRL